MMEGMKGEFFWFLDGPWRGKVQENTFHDLLAPLSLLPGGGPTRYVRTDQVIDLAAGGQAVVYWLEGVPPRERT